MSQAEKAKTRAKTDKVAGASEYVAFSELYLEGGSAIRHKKLSKGKKINAQIEINLAVRSTKTRLCVRQEFDIEAVPQGEEKPVYNLAFAMIAEYKKKRDIDKDQELEVAMKVGLVDIWPFAREYVSNMTARMGMPPLVMTGFLVEEIKEHG